MLNLYIITLKRLRDPCDFLQIVYLRSSHPIKETVDLLKMQPNELSRQNCSQDS